MQEIISSSQNQKIKQVLKLKDGKERREKGMMLIEGKREISLALGSGIKIETLFYCPELASEDDELLLLLNKKIILNTTEDIFKKMAYREHPDGYLAIAKSSHIGLKEIKVSKNPLVIILEGLEKPGNIGAILRSADSAGVDAVIICEAKTDIFNPNVIRSSQGTVFTNQIVLTTTDEVLKWLKTNKIKSFAGHPHAEKVYTKTDFTGPAAIIIGAEDIGLSERWLNETDEKVKIEMRGKIDSLNASVSLAIILFEALRQRGL